LESSDRTAAEETTGESGGKDMIAYMSRIPPFCGDKLCGARYHVKARLFRVYQIFLRVAIEGFNKALLKFKELELRLCKVHLIKRHIPAHS
jgi:hypothetical protein